MTLPSVPCAAVPKSKIKPRLGGLKHLERLLGLHEDGTLSTDAIFVSLDLEFVSDRKLLHLPDEPVITEIGLASLDTRHITSLSLSSNLSTLINTQFYRVLGQPLSKSAKTKNKKECVFTKPRTITRDLISATTIQALNIYDDGCTQKRDIVLVGQSIKLDLKILQRLDTNVFDLAPIVTTIDTYLLARYTLPPFNPNIRLQPDQDFSLSGILSQLGCRPSQAEFHNAGNDATFTLYAMLLLAIKNATSRTAELSPSERRRLKTLRSCVCDTLEDFVSLTLFATRIPESE